MIHLTTEQYYYLNKFSEDYDKANDVERDTLVPMYQQWLSENNLPQLSADAILADDSGVRFFIEQYATLKEKEISNTPELDIGSLETTLESTRGYSQLYTVAIFLIKPKKQERWLF